MMKLAACFAFVICLTSAMEDTPMIRRRAKEIACPERFVAKDWWYTSEPAFNNIEGMKVVVEYKNLRDATQHIMSSEYQVWTDHDAEAEKETNNNVLGQMIEGLEDVWDHITSRFDDDEPHSPAIAFNPDPEGLVVEPNETIKLQFNVDLSNMPSDDSNLNIRAYTNEAGTTSPRDMEIVNATIECW